MDMTKTHGADTREAGGRMSVWLICMALVSLPSGCHWLIREPLPRDPPPGPSCPGGPHCGIDKALMAGIPDPDTNCPTGNCDPGGSGNAKGIYTAEGGNYCFEAMGEKYFCPEAFTNTAEGVVLDVRYLNDASRVVQTRVHGKLAASPNQPVEVLAITSDRTGLAIKYRIQGGRVVYTATGEGLGKLLLGLDYLVMGSGTGSMRIYYELRFTAHQPPEPRLETKDKVHRYRLEYRDSKESLDWLQHCALDGKGPAVAFFQGGRVSGVTASVAVDPNVTTMGCEQGSIVTCLAWGYTPWVPDTGVWDETRDYVYRSCLQAKRAAYFVGKGDFQSYTAKGTEIVLWDQYGSGDGQPVERVEALWSPHGAVCFNQENRRRPDADAWKGQDPGDLNTHGVGPCTSNDFTLQGKVFTGLPPASLAKP